MAEITRLAQNREGLVSHFTLVLSLEERKHWNALSSTI